MTQQVKQWIDSKPYLLNGATWFAWHRPSNRANNSGNGGYPHRTLSNPNPQMDYYVLECNGWKQVQINPNK